MEVSAAEDQPSCPAAVAGQRLAGMMDQAEPLGVQYNTASSDWAIADAHAVVLLTPLL